MLHIAWMGERLFQIAEPPPEPLPSVLHSIAAVALMDAAASIVQP
jgi:hypothetical protein